MLVWLYFPPETKRKEVLRLPGSMLEIKKQIDEIFREETATLIQSVKIKNALKDINICTAVKNKNSIKKLVVTTKIEIASCVSQVPW